MFLKLPMARINEVRHWPNRKDRGRLRLHEAIATVLAALQQDNGECSCPAAAHGLNAKDALPQKSSSSKKLENILGAVNHAGRERKGLANKSAGRDLRGLTDSES